ncbi:MAG: hypothetical protein IKS29_01290, partial [Oscillospiraceae bacterium]|nr:hypothetical protein [Oscillospiraceae bacterium]
MKDLAEKLVSFYGAVEPNDPGGNFWLVYPPEAYRRFTALHAHFAENGKARPQAGISSPQQNVVLPG